MFAEVGLLTECRARTLTFIFPSTSLHYTSYGLFVGMTLHVLHTGISFGHREFPCAPSDLICVCKLFHNNHNCISFPPYELLGVAWDAKFHRTLCHMCDTCWSSRQFELSHDSRDDLCRKMITRNLRICSCVLHGEFDEASYEGTIFYS